MNGNYSIAPSLQDPEDIPTIHLPGDPKFSSYKNSLQEFCQKKRYAVPSYKSTRDNLGLRGSVSFSLNHVVTNDLSSSSKEAESRAAFEALKQLGYLKDAKFEFSTNQLKRKDDGANFLSPVATKSAKLEPQTYKSELNQLAQKKKISNPVYEVVIVNNGFLATVTFNGSQFKALKACKKRKDAEQNAAGVALNALLGTPLPSADEPMVVGEPDVNAMVSEARQAAQPLGAKNRLQEFCQRLSKELPLYDTKLDAESKTYQSIVTAQGMEYTGEALAGKKNAENSAAEVALKALGLMA